MASKKSISALKPVLLAPDFPIASVLNILDATYHYHPMAALTHQNPYKVLVACILSLRTKDETSIPASERLFALAESPQTMVTLSGETIEGAIYPVCFFRNKTRSILDLSADLLTRFGGEVPQAIEDLLTLNGVGRKTANLVVGLGHNLPAICVDIHVHRICQRLGYLQSPAPDDTETLLRENLPAEHWSTINRVMVLHGQACCRPIGPHCQDCPVEVFCQKVAVVPRKSKL
jgi:endonuclease III